MDQEIDVINYKRIEAAIKYLVEHQLNQPTLGDLSSQLGLSESHLQRMFQSWAGISPKQFLQYLTKEYAKSLLRDASVNETSLEVGYSSSSRLHDLMITCESVTPGEYRARGKGMCIDYGWGDSPFGSCFVANCSRGICKLGFFDSLEELEVLKAELFEQYGEAAFDESCIRAEKLLKNIFTEKKDKSELRVVLSGTGFRLKVWEALMRIPEGEVRSYQNIADAIGQPKGSRAVASAIASNPVGLLVPCHRVIRSTGVMSGYRWGEMRKRALIVWEQGRKASLK